MDARRIICILFPLVLLLFAPGCIPFAYIKPDVDIYHATLPADELDASENAVITAVEIQQTQHGNGALNVRSEDSVRLIPVSGGAVTHVVTSSDWSVGFMAALSQSVYRDFDSTVKVYRRGYRTQVVEEGLFSKVATWEECSSLEQRETAIDALGAHNELQSPVAATHFRNAREEHDRDYQRDLFWSRTYGNEFSPDVLRFLIGEYEILEQMARQSRVLEVATRCREKSMRLRERLQRKPET